MAEIRLVAMRVAGTYCRGGLRLVPVAPDHRTAWEQGFTARDNGDLRTSLPMRIGHLGEVAAAKLNAAFTQEPNQ